LLAQFVSCDTVERVMPLHMISELYEKVSVIVTSNKSFETWAEMMGDSVMTTALLDRLLHHARVFTLDGESYRIKKSRKEV
jgi:DNA replication protein DnaC